VRAEHEMASDARTSSSLMDRRMRIAQCGVVIADPERERPGRRVVVVAITLFMVESSAEARPCRRDGHGTGMPGVTGLLVIWFGAPVPLEVVLADMQLEKPPVCVAEPAERAGRGERAGHVVLL
jgi:hypothetical protein